MKVFVLAPRENWIVDRFVNEWDEDNKDISVKSPFDADVIWLLADWCWNQIPIDLLKNKKVLTTVHHIVPEKFNDLEKINFYARDMVTDVYHVYNQQTYDFIRRFTEKPIHLIHYWANQKIWKKTGEKTELRRKHNLPIDDYLIGSFQRDTEGHDLISPKLEKGPDLLADFIEYKTMSKNVHVVLAGWRRQYIISRLEKAKITYTYFERPSHEMINDLYQCLDLYPISARCEGGPQALIECGLLSVPVISREVGIAKQVLPIYSINDDLKLTIPAIPNVDDWKLPYGYEQYRKLILSM
jgi:hypothetical protein